MSEPFAAIKLCIDALDPTTDPVRSDLIDLNRARAELKAARALLFRVGEQAVYQGERWRIGEAVELMDAYAACQPKEGV